MILIGVALIPGLAGFFIKGSLSVLRYRSGGPWIGEEENLKTRESPHFWRLPVALVWASLFRGVEVNPPYLLFEVEVLPVIKPVAQGFFCLTK